MRLRQFSVPLLVLVASLVGCGTIDTDADGPSTVIQQDTGRGDSGSDAADSGDDSTADAGSDPETSADASDMDAVSDMDDAAADPDGAHLTDGSGSDTGLDTPDGAGEVDGIPDVIFTDTMSDTITDSDTGSDTRPDEGDTSDNGTDTATDSDPDESSDVADSTTDSTEVDVPLSDSSEDAFIELGTGAAAFEPLIDGQTIDIVQGFQGGHHVWGALRGEGFDVPTSVVNYRLTQGEVVLAQVGSVPSMTLVDGLMTYWGVTVFFDFSVDTTLLTGASAVLEATLTDDAGHTLSDSRAVTLSCCVF